MGNATLRLVPLLAGLGMCIGRTMAQQLALPAPPPAPVPAQTQAASIRAVVFLDQVSAIGLDPRKWAVLNGEVLDAGGDFVLRLGCDAPEAAALVTRPISVAGMSEIAVQIDAAPTGDPPPPPLALEWSDEQGGWRPIGLIDAQAGAGPRLLSIPPFAGAGSIRIRLAPRGGPGGWLVRAVSVAGTPGGGWSRVQLDSEPLDGGLFAIITDSILAERRVESPATFLVPGRSIRLVAPAEIGGHPFVRWDLGGERTNETRRAIRHELDSGQPAVAHYAPETDPARIASIAIEAIPAEGQHFAVALADDLSFVVEPVPSGESVRFLVGESAAFAAAPRFGRLVFSHWSLDGRLLPHDSALLTLSIDRSATLVAAYELLGDMNDDDAIDKSDIETFILALADPAAYQQRFPTIDRLRRGDVNGDGRLDEADIRRFVELVLGE